MMTQLYRIKPLEWWEVGRGGIWLAGEWIIHRFPNKFRGGHFNGVRYECKSLEEAKAACESHRRKLLEAELEPAYQPTADLPKEPGLYWCRANRKRPWRAVQVYEWRLADRGLYVLGVPLNLFDDGQGESQWIRIPEPEEGL